MKRIAIKRQQDLPDFGGLLASDSLIVTRSGKTGRAVMPTGGETVAQHVAEPNPHPQYALYVEVMQALSELGTASVRDVPVSGNASAAQVVLGSDSRLTNARTPTAHTHAMSDIDGLANEFGTKVDKAAGKQLSTEDYTAADKGKLAGIQPNATQNATDAQLRARSSHTGTQSMGTIDGLASALSAKVDKQTGYGLSQQNYTQAEKTKLAGLESSRWKGEFVSLAALISGVPNPQPGDYADVDAGPSQDIQRYIWDASDGAWVAQAGESTPITASQIKQQYESNPDTNVFNDSEKIKLAGIAQGATANTGTVTSVQVAVPTGLTVSGGPITDSGTLTISYQTGYSIPANSKQNQWDTAYGWGNHAGAGYAPIANPTFTGTVSGVTKAMVGLGNADDTSDLDKPVSNPTLTRFGGASTTSGVLDWNENTAPGIGPVLLLGSAANGPGGGQYHFVWNLEYGTGRQGNGNITQIAIPYGNQGSVNGGVFWFRGRYSGDWTGWERTFTTVTPPTIAQIPQLQAGLDAKVSTQAGYSMPANTKQAQWDQAYGWGNHASAGYATSAALASGLAGKVDTTDVRLTNAREWSASTVTQATAEAGTSTARFAWTAQRVRQAIAAWWATITLTKADVGLDNVDNTADNQKTVHSFIVSDTRAVVSVPNDVPARSGLFEFKLNSSVGSPPNPSTGSYSHVLTINGWTADGTGGWPTQVNWGTEIEFRKGTSATTWGPWLTLATRTWVNAQLADLGGDVKNWVTTTGALTVNAFHKVPFTASRTLTLPSSPSANDFVEIYADGGNATGSTIARNGATIMGLSENLSIDAPMTFIRLVYSGVTWRIAS